MQDAAGNGNDQVTNTDDVAITFTPATQIQIDGDGKKLARIFDAVRIDQRGAPPLCIASERCEPFSEGFRLLELKSGSLKFQGTESKRTGKGPVGKGGGRVNGAGRGVVAASRATFSEKIFPASSCLNTRQHKGK